MVLNEVQFKLDDERQDFDAKTISVFFVVSCIASCLSKLQDDRWPFSCDISPGVLSRQSPEQSHSLIYHLRYITAIQHGI